MNYEMNYELNYEGIEQKSLAEFAEKSYLDYAMSVILDRALPHVADGLKPVQRRIIYAMSELGLKAGAKYKKSARTVGDVLGKYHPHGDSACYEAMVLMAQDFSYRYPFVDGQGNWGSVDDPKSFAAMRYTESRLSPYAQLLLQEVEQGTVIWQDNFDGTLQEPKLLPAQVPNVLLNGAMGIAVGMATDVPPHNLTEVLRACELLLNHPDASLDEVMSVLPAPDYPTGGEIITSVHEIKKVYATGSGSIKQRASYRQEEDLLIIEQLPYQTSGSKVLVQIADQMRAKKLPMVIDLRDESDHESPIRLVMQLKSKRTDVEALMGHLFATSDLEKSFRVNLNLIGLDGRPQVKPLIPLLKEWLIYRQTTIQSRLKHRLQQVEDRLHILQGLLIAFLNIDEVIRIIREEEQPKTQLVQTFALSDIQAEAILNLRLRHLARLEEMQLRAEAEALEKERQQLLLLLSSDARQKTLMKKEFQQIMQTYGDGRRSKLVERQEARPLSEEELIPSETLTIVLSSMGWVRAAKGADVDGRNLSYKSGDQFLDQCRANSRQAVVFWSNQGRAFSLPAHSLPSARGQGEPLTSRISLQPDETLLYVTSGTAESLWILASTNAYGFVMQWEDALSKTKNGKLIVTLDPQASLLKPQPLPSHQAWCVLVSSEPKLLIFSAEEMPRLAKGKGNKLMQLDAQQQLNALGVVPPGARFELVSESDYRKVIAGGLLESAVLKRAKKGVVLPRTLKKVVEISLLDGDVGVDV